MVEFDKNRVYRYQRVREAEIGAKKGRKRVENKMKRVRSASIFFSVTDRTGVGFETMLPDGAIMSCTFGLRGLLDSSHLRDFFGMLRCLWVWFRVVSFFFLLWVDNYFVGLADYLYLCILKNDVKMK